jgi:hypothetical protein
MLTSSFEANEVFLRSNPSRIPKESIYMIDEERNIALRVSFIFKNDVNDFCFDSSFLDQAFGKG